MIGFAMCGSFCTHKRALEALGGLLEEGYEVLPVFSESVFETDTRFGRAEDRFREVTALCGREPIHTGVDAEPLGPAVHLAPATRLPKLQAALPTGQFRWRRKRTSGAIARL